MIKLEKREYLFDSYFTDAVPGSLRPNAASPHPDCGAGENSIGTIVRRRIWNWLALANGGYKRKDLVKGERKVSKPKSPHD